MKVRYYKHISIFFVYIMLFSMFSYIPQVQASIGSHTKYNDCTEVEFSAARFNEIIDQLPIGTILTNAKGLYFNLKLWHDKNIVVYGNHNSVSNDFKKGSQDEYGTYNSSEGYYYDTVQGVPCNGEYRYHGQDAKGNNYTNINFKHDFPQTVGLGDKKWLYTPWENQLITKEQPKQSDYNNSALRGDIKAQEWIGATAQQFEISQAFDQYGKDLSAEYYSQKWNFIHVLTPPTATHPGEGRLWHKTGGNSTRYQTLSISPVKKKPTNVDLKLELLTPQAELNVFDTDDATAANAEIPVRIKITATLKDEGYYNDSVNKVNYYTRYDIANWTIKIGNSIVTGVSSYDNLAAKSEHTVYFKVSEIRANSFTSTIEGSAYTTYTDKTNSTTDTCILPISFTKTPVAEPPVIVDLHPNIPDKWYDIVAFPASDSTDLTDIVSREVYIDGTQIDAAQFFSGKYIFGESKLWLNQIRMVWNTKDGQALEVIEYTVIYPTKPNAEYRLTGSYIQNRKMNVTDNSLNSNLEFVYSKFPIVGYEWSFRELTGETGNLKKKEISITSKDFLCKKPGKYEIELVVTNSLGRKSDPYIVTFTILEDYTAAVICNLNNSVLARNEEISAYAYEAVSTDGDIIANNTVELWYDSDNNETYDQLVQTWNSVTTFPAYTPAKLGKYKFVNIVTEEFGQPTIPEFVTAADRKTITVEREFWVDNYIPMTGIYVDIPIVRPEVDMFFMLDENLKVESSTWIKDNRMNINNTMRLYNIIAKVDNWDLKTYEYKQPASTTLGTGTSYPPLSTIYSSDGYSGTLNRISVSDNGSYKDFGSYVTTTTSRTFSASWTNNQSSSGWTNPWEVTSSSSNPAPSSLSINIDGYSGSIPKTNTVTNYSTGYVYGTAIDGRRPWTASSSYTAYYSGTLTKTVSVWVSDMEWVSNYTGYYEGTIYKYLKQPYTAPFVTTHKKYAIYVADEDIANLADLNMVNSNNDIDIILIGNTTAQSQIDNAYFILNDGSSIESLVDKAVQWIAEQNPVPSEDIITTQNTPFAMSEADYDQEGDLILNKSYQYVHNKDYYDNPTGQEPDTQTAYSDTTGWTTTKKDCFANVGLYTIYRRVQDQPTTDPNFEEYNKTSNIPYLTVAVHRIPIAQPAMTWKYDPISSLYKLTFEDNSYDLDHQYTRDDKGIIETKIRYRKEAGEWNYKMPTDLTWGNYEIEYLVKDIEQAWSLPYIMNVNLSQVPLANITIEGAATPKLVKMRGETTIPAGETLLITSPDKASGPIIHSNIPITTAQVLVNGASIGSLTLTSVPSETEYLYTTNILEYNVPVNMADGSINIIVRAASTIGSQSKDQALATAVYTPIWEDYSDGRLAYISDALEGVSSSMELSTTTAHEKLNDFKVITSKYTNKLQVKIGTIIYYIFKNGTVGTNGTSSTYTSIIVNGLTQKYKVSDILVNTTVDNREWNFKFSVVNNYPLEFNQPVTMSFTGYDEAGSATATLNKHSYNPQSKIITPNNYLLYNFRVVKVRDLSLESYYRSTVSGAGQQQYIDKPMFVNSMAIDAANFGGITDGLTKGYRFEFEIDSKNFNAAADTIVIEPHFYTADAFTRDIAERELYWEDSNHQVYKAGEGGHAAWKTIILTSADRIIKSTEEATWRGEYLIPGTAWAVPMGTTITQSKNKNLKRDIIVSFNIKGYKNGVLQFNYNVDQWPKERTTTKYPYQIGDVIKYSWDKSCLDDIKTKDNR